MKTFARISIALLFALPFTANAQVAPPPPIPSVTVTDTCTPTAANGTTHTYTAQFLGICALLAAKNQGAITAYDLSYSASFGFFLNSLNGIVPGGTEFWDLLQNGIESSVGLSSMAISQGDIISFQRMDWTTSTAVGSAVRFKIGTLTATPAATPASSGGGGLNLHAPFDVTLALSYLAGVQSADGSFGSPMLNDWTAIATAIGTFGDLRTKLAVYEASHPLVSTIVTENERHAMALEALGINPYSGTSVDYITPIVAAFDGVQIGEASLVNDDIFAIFPLLHAGYTNSDPIIASTTAFILSKQAADGSWAGSVDVTAAALQALARMPDTGEVRGAVNKAIGYLRDKQVGDGGFGDPFSTSWVLQAIAALNGTASDWQRGIYTPDYYLATIQQSDGGVGANTVDTQSRIWATAYAIPAIKRATWDSLLSSFPKPAPVQTPAATTTKPVNTAATSTPAVIPQEPLSHTAPAQATITEAAAKTAAQPTSTEPVATPLEPQAQTAAAASVPGGRSVSLLFELILAALFVMIVLWSLANAYNNRKRN